MTGIAWTAFVPAAAVAAAVPGANQLLGLRHAARYGVRAATVASLGRFAAFVVLAGVVVAGLGALLTRSAAALGILTWLGVAYLAWVGLSTLWCARTGTVAQEAQRAGSLLRREFVVAVTNPKALLLFAAFLPQFVGTAPDPGPRLAVLAVAYIGIEAVVAVAYAMVGGRLRRSGVAGSPGRLHRRLDAVTGAVFLVLAGALAVDRVTA